MSVPQSRLESRPGTPAAPEGRQLSDAAAVLSARWATLEDGGDTGDQDGSGATEPNDELDTSPGVVGDETHDGFDEADADPTEAGADGESDATDPWTLTELLDAGATTPANLAVNVRINGEEQEVTLEEALRGYQRQADYDLNNRTLREERAAAEQALSAQAAELEDHFQFAGGMLAHDEQQLAAQYQQWQTASAALRQESPDEWAAQYTEFQQAQQVLANRKQQLHGRYTTHKQKQAEQAAQRNQEYVTQQRAQAARLHTEWANEATYASDRAAIAQHVFTTYGVPVETFNAVADAVTLDMFRKAKLYDEATSGIPDAKKQAARPTGRKLLRPGARATRGAGARTAEGQLRQKLKDSGRQEDAVALLRHRLGG